MRVTTQIKQGLSPGWEYRALCLGAQILFWLLKLLVVIMVAIPLTTLLYMYGNESMFTGESLPLYEVFQRKLYEPVLRKCLNRNRVLLEGRFGDGL